MMPDKSSIRPVAFCIIIRYLAEDIFAWHTDIGILNHELDILAALVKAGAPQSPDP